jgi:hypothetical protein
MLGKHINSDTGRDHFIWRLAVQNGAAENEQLREAHQVRAKR